jgi:hypothetical protein
MSREYRFVQVDVFTDHMFGGNPLAVVLDGRRLSDVEMQAIAKEMNLTLRADGDRITDIRVGGGVVPVLEGRPRARLSVRARGRESRAVATHHPHPSGTIRSP